MWNVEIRKSALVRRNRPGTDLTIHRRPLGVRRGICGMRRSIAPWAILAATGLLAFASCAGPKATDSDQTASLKAPAEETAGSVSQPRQFNADAFVARVDASPPEEQPPNWNHVKRLMARKAPFVGESAPDFTLPAFDGSGSVTRSEFHDGRPLVLIFGSYT